MRERTGLKRSGHRDNAQPAKPVESLDQAALPRQTQMGQALSLKRSKPVSSPRRTSGPPACFDSNAKVCPDHIDSGLDSRKMAPGTAFHYASAGGASVPFHEQDIEKSIEKSA